MRPRGSPRAGATPGFRPRRPSPGQAPSVYRVSSRTPAPVHLELLDGMPRDGYGDFETRGPRLENWWTRRERRFEGTTRGSDRGMKTVTRPRNNQRARAERAEAALTGHPENMRYEDLTAMCDWMAAVAQSDLMTHYLRRAGLNGEIHLRVGDGRGRRSYTLGPDDSRGLWEASFPSGTRSQAHVVTILPWLVAEQYQTIALDGPEVVAMRLALAEAFMTPAAGEAYRQALGAEGVRRTSDHAWPGGGTAVVRSVDVKEYAKVSSGGTRRRSIEHSTRPRDSQRARLYRTEAEVSNWATELMGSIDQVQKYVRGVETSMVWEVLGAGHRRVSVKDGRGGSRSRACSVGYEIHMRNGDRFPMMVLHELAHIATDGIVAPVQVAPHGPEFVTVYFILISEHLGRKPAEEFLQACERHSVRLCEETLAQCRARLAGFLNGLEYLVEPEDPHPWSSLP